MAYNLWFGKFKGHSLEEVALGKKFSGVKHGDEGYHYFDSLAHGDPKYFGMFQNSFGAMNRWQVIHHKLNNFKAVFPCVECGSDNPIYVSIAGERRLGYNMGRNYICCDKPDCKRALTSQPSGAVMLYPLGFDTILQFGWSGRGKKLDERDVVELMRELAGWKSGKRITPESATEFIDGLTLR